MTIIRSPLYSFTGGIKAQKYGGSLVLGMCLSYLSQAAWTPIIYRTVHVAALVEGMKTNTTIITVGHSK